MPSPRFLHALAAHAASQPDEVALVFNEQYLTYRQLNELADDLRLRVGSLSPASDQPVCVPAHKTPETIALIIGCLRAGRSVLAPSPALGADAMATLCAQARCSHLLAAGPDEDGARLTATAVTPDAQQAEGFARVDSRHSRLLLTTSGSTGTPKIVPITTAGFDNFAAWAAEYFTLTAGSAALSYSPLNFDLSLLDVWTLLAEGGRVVLVDGAQSTDARHLQNLVLKHDVTFVQGVPMLYRLLTENGEEFTSTTTVVFTGEALPQGMLEQLALGFPKARFHNIFGCTETNDSFVHDVDPATARHPLPIGRPLAGVRAVLVDEDGEVITGAGTGELLVTTPFQTSGYLQTSRNTEVFVPGPDGSGAVFYRTGDMVTRDADGLYHLEGRNDFQVKVRGVRTNMQEVENVLTLHPDVVEAAVVALPDPQAGNRLHAAVTRRQGSGLTSLRLRTHCARHLPRNAIPSSLAVGETPLPRTPTGKPDRNLIKKARMEGTT